MLAVAALGLGSASCHSTPELAYGPPPFFDGGIDLSAPTPADGGADLAPVDSGTD